MLAEKFKVLLVEDIHPVARHAFESAGCYVEDLKASPDRQFLLEKLPQFHCIGIRSKTNLTKEILAAGTQLLAVGTFCIGTDQVDLATARASGVPVFNSPYSNTRSVAEMIIAEIIALTRRICDRNQELHRGVWKKTAKDCHEVRGKVLGIVGYGHIGSQLSILAESLGMNVVFYDVVKKLPLGNSMAMSSLEDLLRVADFVSLHVPDTELTRNMIGDAQIKKMKKGSYLLNASRGKVVQISALVAALKEKHILGAAVDVFPREPASSNEAFESELRGLENVILTPHIGGSTEEAQEAIGREVSTSLINYLTQGDTHGAVNFPWVTLHKKPGSHRILNVHKNVPGVLGDINSIVSSAGVNILSQSLSTDNDIGYLIMDMDQKGPVDHVLEKISQLKTSMKTRVVT